MYLYIPSRLEFGLVENYIRVSLSVKIRVRKVCIFVPEFGLRCLEEAVAREPEKLGGGGGDRQGHTQY